jgi:hypothetical protein
MGRTLAPAGNDRDYLQLAELSTYLRPAGLSTMPASHGRSSCPCTRTL